MFEDDDDNTPPPEALNKLLAAAKDELKAYKPSKRVTRLVTRQRVVDLTEIQLNSWAPMVDLLDQVLAPAYAEQRKLELKRLDTRAWVYYAAELAAEGPNSNLTKAQAAKLAIEVAKHDRYLFGWAVPMFGSDPTHAATLRDISRGSGKRDDAEDVERLVTLFSDNWDQVKDNPWVTKAYLDNAATDAAKQLDYLRNRAKSPARKLADAAYALWYADYDELMHLGRYLTRREEDSRVRFPGVREEMTFSGGAEVAAGEEVEDEGQDSEVEDEDSEEDPNQGGE